MDPGLSTLCTLLTHCRLISHKIQPIRQKKKKAESKRETYSFGELSRLCRYLKIDIKSFNPSGENGTMIVDIFGVKDFIIPAQPSDDWIPKLKAQIRSAEEKHHVLSSDFVGKRRKLTTLRKILS